MKYFGTALLLSASVSIRGQQPTGKDFTTIESAWASARHLANTVVTIRRGFNPAAPLESASTDGTGSARTTTKYWERIEIHFPRIGAADTVACLMIDSKCNALPVGASLDKKNSILYWHVPNAYKGDFDLVFFQPGSAAGNVRVTAGSK